MFTKIEYRLRYDAINKNFVEIRFKKWLSSFFCIDNHFIIKKKKKHVIGERICKTSDAFKHTKKNGDVADVFVESNNEWRAWFKFKVCVKFNVKRKQIIGDGPFVSVVEGGHSWHEPIYPYTDQNYRKSSSFFTSPALPITTTFFFSTSLRSNNVCFCFFSFFLLSLLIYTQQK